MIRLNYLFECLNIMRGVRGDYEASLCKLDIRNEKVSVDM